MHERWPRLRLVPQEALLELLEQLPGYFRALAAGQPAHLPAQLVSGVFKGVTHLLSAQHPREAQVLSLDAPPGTANPSRQSVVARGQPPSTFCGSSSAGHQAGAAASPRHRHSLSGYWHEPIMQTDASQADDAVMIGALGCGGQPSISSSEGVTGVARSVEVLPLQETACSSSSCSAQQHQQTGVVWSCNSCPVLLLRSLHASAGATLRAQTHQAIQATGTASVSTIPRSDQWLRSSDLMQRNRALQM